MAAIRAVAGDGNTFCDLGRTVTRLDQDIPSLGTECCRDGRGKSVNTGQKGGSGFDAKFEFLDIH